MVKRPRLYILSLPDHSDMLMETESAKSACKLDIKRMRGRQEHGMPPTRCQRKTQSSRTLPGVCGGYRCVTRYCGDPRRQVPCTTYNRRRMSERQRSKGRRNGQEIRTARWCWFVAKDIVVTLGLSAFPKKASVVTTLADATRHRRWNFLHGHQ